MLPTNRRFFPVGRPGSWLLAAIVSLFLVSCGKDQPAPPERKAGTPPTPAAAPKTTPAPGAQPAAGAAAAAPDAAQLLNQAKAIFTAPLPTRFDPPDNPASEAKIALGRMLYYEPRLSRAHDISCNSCHSLTDFGIDVREPEGKRQVSKGHKGETGDRNSPTVYNAALHFRQFWDGRAANLVEQAKGPVLNPVEMAMPDEKSVTKLLETIPGYVDAFKKAFPDDAKPITYDNMARAIAVFEGGLLTPAPFDEFLGGKTDALNAQQLRGLSKFIEATCITCHSGTALGGGMYQKLGLLKPYETKDLGRFQETKLEADKYMFKVPSLRNIEKTGPYLHDGSIESLSEMVAIMSEHQTPRGKLSDEEIADIVSFLGSLTGKIPQEYIAKPELPPSGPKTPKPQTL